MKKKKKVKFFRKIKSWRDWRIFVFVSIIIIVLIALQIGIKVNFLTRSELFIEVEPLQDIITTDYNKTINLNFTIKTHNFWFCKSACKFSLYDPYEEKTLFFENITLNSNTKTNRTYSFNLNTNGEGQRVYYFEAECSNKRTLLCKTDGNKVSRNSFVAINYRLPKAENILRDKLKTQLNAYSKEVDMALNLVEENKLLMMDINKVKNETYKEEKVNLTLLLNSQDLWSQNKYYELNDDFEMHDKVKFLMQMKNESKKNILTYNLIADIFNSFKHNEEKLNNAFSFLNNTNISYLTQDINALYLTFNLSSFEESIKIVDDVLSENESFFNILRKYEYEKNNFEKELALEVKTNYAIQLKVFEILGLNQSNLTGKDCQDVIQISEDYKLLNINVESQQVKFSQYFNSTEFIIVKDAIKKSIMLDNFTVILDNTTFIINNSVLINNTLNLTKEDYVSVLQFNETLNLCKDFNQSVTLLFEPLKKINVTDYDKNISVNIEFKNNPLKCCIFNSCFNCTTGIIPTIFLHGHASIEDNPVEQVLGSFSAIQKKMSEDNFINVGDIDITTANFDEMWSMMNYPITVKASFYYTIYYDIGIYAATVRKSESIESYAIRLKELIELVKEKTGAEKVNIVSHSMGGLVSREYLVLFGEESVNKLIMISTPNYGIRGKTKQFCSDIGSDKECLDMYNDSVFLKKLNRNVNIPKKVQFYTIYGTGCNTDGLDGDGVIVAEDVTLDYAENFKVVGKCNDLLGVSLHNDILNPSLHPEVYDKVLEILS